MQEWSEEVLEMAAMEEKPLFVSIGYSTCHWCHVMAREAFSDETVADYINLNFIPIKVDREQRPDIDQFAMDFMTATQGRGGWPLNILLSPDKKPYFAFTYLPVEEKHGLLGIVEVLKKAQEWYSEHGSSLEDYEPNIELTTKDFKLEEIVSNLIERKDPRDYGFGITTKFPPHTSLLFLGNYLEMNEDSVTKGFYEKTLDVMATRGLHDHLQGGFYRYTVDREWHIPHFEKMLYDQAMHLWNYSTVYKLTGEQMYKKVVERLDECLENTFRSGDLYFSSHDADTDHVEGKTYVWEYDELKELLTKDEFRELESKYSIEPSGNFEGKIHLVGREWMEWGSLESKLLSERNKRTQPFTDHKFLTPWNSLLGVAYLIAGRIVNDDYSKNGTFIYDGLVNQHYKEGIVHHSSLEGVLQQESYLEDYASLLLLATYVHELRGGEEQVINTLLESVKGFNIGGKWFNSLSNGTSLEIQADVLDHPIPSVTSVTENAIFRAGKLLKTEVGPVEYSFPMERDFHNVSAFHSAGNLVEVHIPLGEDIELPINSIRIDDTNLQLCSKGLCTKYKTLVELKKSLKEIIRD